VWSLMLAMIELCWLVFGLSPLPVILFSFTDMS